jgi:hypothetical protein
MVGQVTGLKNRERLRSDVHTEPTAVAPDAKINLTSSGANGSHFN